MNLKLLKKILHLLVKNTIEIQQSVKHAIDLIYKFIHVHSSVSISVETQNHASTGNINRHISITQPSIQSGHVPLLIVFTVTVQIFHHSQIVWNSGNQPTNAGRLVFIVERTFPACA